MISGHLTDVWEPAVLDADPSSPTYNKTVRPHWHYAYDEGFSFHDGSFTTAGEADYGFSMGLGGGNGFGVQIAGTFFIPINMPEWYKYI